MGLSRNISAVILLADCHIFCNVGTYSKHNVHIIIKKVMKYYNLGKFEIFLVHLMSHYSLYSNLFP